MMETIEKRYAGVRATLPVLMLAAAFSFGTVSSAVAGTFTCYVEGSCPNAASCSGDLYQADGCKLQCYNYGSSPGEVVAAGSADCSDSGGGGGTEPIEKDPA